MNATVYYIERQGSRVKDDPKIKAEKTKRKTEIKSLPFHSSREYGLDLAPFPGGVVICGHRGGSSSSTAVSRRSRPVTIPVKAPSLTTSSPLRNSSFAFALPHVTFGDHGYQPKNAVDVS